MNPQCQASAGPGGDLFRLTPCLDTELVGGDGFPVTAPWYVVHTKARQEQLASENLVRQGYAVYLPRIKILKRGRDGQRIAIEPLFPRYLFIRPGSPSHSIAPVRSTQGVACLVRFGHLPAVMRANTLDDIRSFELRLNQVSDESLSPFRPGKLVRVADGPLAGLEGLISSVSQQRVIVLLQLLGRDTRVDMTCHHLSVAD